MKMISSTSMTSTIGVTLISAMTGRRRCRRLPATAADSAFIAMPIPSSPFVDLPRQDGGKLVGKPLQALGLFVHVGYELVIENSRRYGGDQANRGREQGLRDARGDHRQGGGLLAGNRPKAGHDAPYGSEQADKGAGRADGREHQEVAFQARDLALDGHIHDL